MVKAAVLHEPGKAPRYEDFAEPTPEEGEVLVRMKAASLKNVERMMAEGTHYDSHGALPAVVGLDGVGVLEDGTRVYCGGCRPPYGMMAELAAVPRAICLPIPEEVDDSTAAALPNPALSAWLALEWRANLQPQETALILGATGVAGKLAVQVCKHLGAGKVVAAGRNEKVLETLPGLGADATISLAETDSDLEEAFAREAVEDGYDVVLDYLWGRPTEILLEVLTGQDVMEEAARTRLVQLGEMANSTISLPAAALRSSGLEILGSGGGSIPPKAIFETLPRLWELAAGDELRIDIEKAPLDEVEEAWRGREPSGRRLVFTVEL